MRKIIRELEFCLKNEQLKESVIHSTFTPCRPHQYTQKTKTQAMNEFTAEAQLQLVVHKQLSL